MTPLYLNKEQIGIAFETTPDVAKGILAERGVYPVDFGRGRGKGLRWYFAAVQQAAYEMHLEAQKKANPDQKPASISLPKPGLIQGRSANDIYAELTQSGPTQ